MIFDDLWAFLFLFPLVVVVGVVFWRAGASACFGVFLFPFGCCDLHLSFGACSCWFRLSLCGTRSGSRAEFQVDKG